MSVAHLMMPLFWAYTLMGMLVHSVAKKLLTPAHGPESCLFSVQRLCTPNVTPTGSCVTKLSAMPAAQDAHSAKQRPQWSTRMYRALHSNGGTMQCC